MAADAPTAETFYDGAGLALATGVPLHGTPQASREEGCQGKLFGDHTERPSGGGGMEREGGEGAPPATEKKRKWAAGDECRCAFGHGAHEVSCGWRQLDASAKEAQYKTEAIRAEGQREAAEAKGAHASALAKKEALAKRCEERETNLKAFHEKIAEMQQLELRRRMSQPTRLELESPLIPEGASYAELSSELVKELEGMVKKVDDILEEEFRDLFFVVGTSVFSHLLLHDPCFKFDE
ncbi:hypothetical protein D1007_56800 [Hordeum vulgare]|nr:hypothetical protein D1007_56800 [Hordeum vulgare]